jgi:two-component system, sensor histidine kinase and response regulator
MTNGSTNPVRAPASDADSPAPAKILIVDDLAQNRRSLEALLRRDDVQVLEARSGREALELLLVHEVALAFIDVQMPEMDGFELAELMRGTLRTREVPIIFVTAGAADRHRTFQGYEAGAVDFLFKPLEVSVLRQKTDVFLRLYRQRRELAETVEALRASAEERERLVRELTESLRLADMFSAVLGHDLRNPLSVITTSAETLLRRAPEDPLRRPAQRILSSGQRMGRMIEELLDMARARMTGGFPLSPCETDLLSLCRRVVADHEISHGARGISFSHEGDPGGFWDEDRLFQVLANLIGNALEHGRKGAPIAVRVDGTGREQVVISVHSGGAIPPAMMPYLFDPFRVRQKQQSGSRGLGLGLYIVREIVEAHGGQVDVTSSEAAGTLFVVTLPRRAPPSAADLNCETP